MLYSYFKLVLIVVITESLAVKNMIKKDILPTPKDDS